MKVINLWGAPGSGKSTTAAGLYYKMKVNNDKVELIHEYVKDLIWEDHLSVLEDQNYIFANQNRMLKRLEGKVDYVITDSPIPLSTYYVNDKYIKERPSFKAMVWEEFNNYENINFYLLKDHEYQEYGRLHNEKEAENIGNGLLDILNENKVEYYNVKTGNNIIEEIYKKINLLK